MGKLKIVLPIIGMILTFSDVYAYTTNNGMNFFTQSQNYGSSCGEKLLDL